MMSTSVYEIAGDYGNWGAKVAREGQSLVMRNVAVPYDGNDDAFRETMSYSRQAGDEDAVPTESARIWLQGQQWVVGEAAYDIELLAKSQTSYARYGTPEWYALIAASFAKLYPKRSGTVALTFSMPVSQFRAEIEMENGQRIKQKEYVARLLCGTWEIEYEGRKLIYEVPYELLDMVPEGVGTLFSQCVHPSGKRWIDEKLAGGKKVIFDFGGFTLDVLTLEGLKPMKFNRSLTTGLIHVRNAVEEKLVSRFNRGDVPPTVLDEVIRTGMYKHAGHKPVSVQDVVDGAMVKLMKDALSVWREELGSGADFDTVIITGGGGPVIGPLLEAQLKHGDVRILPTGEAHLANAKGGLIRRRFMNEAAAATA
jgi:hypothetical protein